MNRSPAAATGSWLAILLCLGILTMWVPERWALSVYQAGAFALAGVWMARIAARPSGPVRICLALGAPVVMALWGIAQLAAQRTVYPWQTWNSVLHWMTMSALFFLGSQAATEAEARRRFLNTLLGFAAALSVVATVQLFTSEGKIFWVFPSGYPDLVLGPFVYQNQYAAFIETVLPLALWRAVTEPERSSRYWVMTAVMVASVIAGGSRAGSFLVLAEIPTVLALAWRRHVASRRTIFLAAGQFALALTVATAVVGWDFVWRRFQQADPYRQRREMALSSAQMVKERPWIGFGLGTWPTVYPKYALYDDGLFVNQAHNDWAQWAVEGGVPMLAVMLAFAALLARPAARSLWGIGVLCVLIHCLVDYPMQQRPALAGWFFAICGVLAGSAAKRARVESRPAG